MDVRSCYEKDILTHHGAGVHLIDEYIFESSQITTKQLHRTWTIVSSWWYHCTDRSHLAMRPCLHCWGPQYVRHYQSFQVVQAYTSMIPWKPAPVLVVVLEVHWEWCSRIIVTRTYRMISFRKCKLLGDWMGSFLSITFSLQVHQQHRMDQSFASVF